MSMQCVNKPCRGTPLAGLVCPDDIAKGIVFLACNDSGFMTGAGLVVEGGSTAQ